MKNTAFKVASDNSTFLLSLADAIDSLPLSDRMMIRGKILAQNEKNLEVMRQSITSKRRTHEKTINS